MATTTLSNIKPDFAQIVTQLQTALAGKDGWKDLLKSSTGQTIVELLASLGEIDQFMIEQQLRQAYIDTAVTDSAVYAAAKTLGVRLNRKTPAQIEVVITRTGANFTIPAYTAFSCNGVLLFNRTAILVNASSVNATLYEGELRTTVLESDGSDFQLYKSPERDFTVSDIDTRITVGVTTIPVVQNGLWEYPSESAVSDLTTNDGELLLTFGSSLYGFKPGVGVSVTVKYVVTQGSDASNASLNATAVTPLVAMNATILSSSGLYGGGAQQNVDTMRKLSPLLFSARNRATTESEFNAVAATYPGVQDAIINGQQKIAPTDVRFMNAARVSLLMATPMTNTQWNDFVAWFTQRTMYPIRFFRKDPVPIEINITANVFCRPQADLGAVDTAIRANLDELVKREPGILGKNIYRSDIYRAIHSADEDVEYAELILPTTDKLIDVTIASGTISSNFQSGATLIPGQSYSYGISVVTPSGESLVKLFLGAIVDTGDNRLTIGWTKVEGATGYKIYGRGPTSYGLMATLGPSTFTFSDNGSITPGGPMPMLDNSGIFYPILGDVLLDMRYTERD